MSQPIRPSTALQLQTCTASEKSGPRMVLAGLAGTVELDGAVLEAQFDCGDQHLVFTTDDVPYEEALHIHLLDARLAVLDWLELSAWYTPGIFDDLAPAGPHSLAFTFFDETERWRLTVLQSPRFGLVRHPVKRRSEWWRRSWLRLERTE